MATGSVIPEFLERKQDAIGALCERFGVTRLELFGSAATGEFDPARSDVDFLVFFRPPRGMDAGEQYFGLHRALEAALGRSVHLVEAHCVVNPYVRRSIARSRIPFYAAA